MSKPSKTIQAKNGNPLDVILDGIRIDRLRIAEEHASRHGADAVAEAPIFFEARNAAGHHYLSAPLEVKATEDGHRVANVDVDEPDESNLRLALLMLRDSNVGAAWAATLRAAAKKRAKRPLREAT